MPATKIAITGIPNTKFKIIIKIDSFKKKYGKTIKGINKNK